MFHCRDSKNKGECADMLTDANSWRRGNIRKSDNNDKDEKNDDQKDSAWNHVSIRGG